MARYDIVVFDLDGTLVDSDEALVIPFVTLGVPRDAISFGHPIEVECTRLGLDVLDYVAAYDTTVVQPFPGVADMLGRLGRWAVCSNKHPISGLAELERLGWEPEIALFSDDFGGAAKELGPVLAAADVHAGSLVFVGDTAHDELCARDAGCDFIWAGWNPRTMATAPNGTVASTPAELLELIGSTR